MNDQYPIIRVAKTGDGKWMLFIKHAEVNIEEAYDEKIDAIIASEKYIQSVQIIGRQ